MLERTTISVFTPNFLLEKKRKGKRKNPMTHRVRNIPIESTLGKRIVYSYVSKKHLLSCVEVYLSNKNR